MNPLAQALVEGILGENASSKKKIVGMFGGGFKPPTSGHLEVVKKALQENPEMDALIILVGSGTRDSISQEESLAIWNIYKKSLPSKVVVMASPDNKPPIGAIYSYAKKNPDKEIYWFIGEREGNKDDFYDFIKRTRALRKGDYTNIQAKKITTADAVSGTKARKALLAKDKETFIQFIPNIPEVDEIWDMLTDVVKEYKHKYDKEELRKGIEVEKEHTDDPKIALKIALDHLDEDPQYYTKLATLGLEEQFLQERIAYDAETRMQTRFLMKQFLKTVGTKIEDSTEGTLVGDEYELVYGFYPMKKGLGFMPFKVEGSAGPKDIAITIKYNPELLDKKLYSELSAELRNSVRHELEHLAQYRAEKGVRPGEDGVDQDDLPDVEYLTLDYEIPGHIQGLRTKAKAKKISLQQAIDDLFDSAEYDLDLDEEDFVRETWMNWLKTNMPGVSLTKIKEGSAMPKNVNPDELRKGIEVEKEHTDNPKIALKIALDHLAEDPEYYTKLATLGLEEAIAHEMGSEDWNNIGNALRNPKKAKAIYGLLLQMFPKQKEVIDYNYKNDAFAEMKRVIHGIDKYKLIGPITVQPKEMKLAPEIEAEREKKFQQFAKGEIDKYFRDDKTDPRKVDVSKFPPITMDEEGFVSDGNHRAFIAKKQNKPLKAYKYIAAKNDHPNVAKILKLVGRSLEENIDQQDVEDLDNLADRELNPIDVVLTGKHFFDRLNDPRNRPEIDYLELEDFFTKLGDNREEFIDFLNKYKSVVATDTETNINIPFMKMANKAIAKTIMRKRNFKTPNVKVELEEEVPQDVINSFDIQDTLVPEVWDNEQLKPEVREKLLQIAQDFFDSLELPKGTKLKDIKLTGSLANYNWSKFSDFDLHLVLDFSEIDDNEEFVRNYFMAKKGIWNDAHDITKERLRNMRSSGLEKGGEYSVENLAFKVLRRSDIIGQLNDLKSKSYDTMMSLLNEGKGDNIEFYIKPLTDYMAQELNLSPYPSLEYVEDDKENEANIFGKTAYYMPSEKKVVLFTLGRHPKDILRSYAHELIHHHQNLSGTLNHSNTTNTNEDGALEDIEREAYETGNILFRKWEDSLKNN
jgi:uncharacterized alkaline shock family protein YloU